MTISRREFLKKSALVLAFAGVAGAVDSLLIQPNWIRNREYELVTSKWPKEMGPLTIAIAADLHVGCPSISLETIDKISKRLNEMNADMILLLGDFLTARGKNGLVVGGEYVPPEPIAEKLAQLHAPLGVHAVLGNHDWICDGKGMWKALEKSGIYVQENSAVHIVAPDKSFWLAGLADDTTRTPDLRKTFNQVTNGDPVISMMHDPGTFLDRNGRSVVSLAGHTHGGQVSLPIIGAPVRPVGRSPRHYAYGHIVEGGEDLIVTSGLGTSMLPVRFGVDAMPELVKLTIRHP